MKKNTGIQFFLKTAFLLFLLVAAGYLRDSIFKSINALLKAWDYGQDYFLPAPLSFLENYEYDTLLNIKWLLTLLFSALYFLIGLLALRIVFGNGRYNRIFFFTYAGLVTLAGLFIGTGAIFSGTSDKMYEFARYVMGMTQSPVVLMILIPALKLSEKEKIESKGN